MTGEEIYRLLNKMAVRGETPRQREKKLKRLADKLGLSSDALRAKARRFARKEGIDYPLMRKPASEDREQQRQSKRSTREQWRTERIELGKEALARGAEWADLAVLFNIKTPEGAAQWWRRNVEGLHSRSIRRKARSYRRSSFINASAAAGQST